MLTALDIRTLVLLASCTHFIQLLVLYYQYRTIKRFNGIGYWVIWSGLELIGFLALLLRTVPGIETIAIFIQNHAIIGGTVAIYVGIVKFNGESIRWKPLLIPLLLFITIFNYFLFIDNDIYCRSLILGATLAIISFITAGRIYKPKIDYIRSAAHFTAFVLVLHGLIFSIRTIVLVINPGDDSIFTPTLFNIIPFLDAIFVGLLWTFGFILLTNQRLTWELLETQRDLKLVFNTSPDASIITRLEDGKIYDYNEGYLRITGFSKEDLIDSSTINLNIWKNIQDRYKIISLLKENGVVENYEAQFIKKDGTEITGLMSARIINIQGVPHIMSISRDITLNKEKELALKDSEGRFRSVFEYAGVGKSLTTLDGRINVNQAFCDMVGYTKEELNNLKWEDITYPDDIEADFEKMKSLNRSKSGQAKWIKRYIHKDGSIIWAQVNSVLYREESKPLYFITTVTDITEQKHYEDEIRKLNDELEKRVQARTSDLQEANKELESFTYTVSHDLRTPLRGINGFTQLLISDYADKLDDEAKRYCQILIDSSNKMGTLIDDLLAFSRLHQSELIFMNIDMESLFHSVYKELMVNHPSRSIQFTVAKLPAAYGDQNMIQQVVVNLLSNAIKFTSLKENAKIEVQSKLDGGTVTFSVKDNGAGFDEKYLNKLFGIFQRLHKASEFEGTGVGLAIVQRIVQRHGGRVWAESVEGQGATFYFTLSKTI